MKKAYSVVLSLVLVFTACIVETGCNSSKFDTVVATIEKQLPAAVALGTDIASVTDPALAPVFALVGQAAAADLPVIQQAIATYNANKTSGTKQALFAAVSSLTTSINAQVLAANKVVSAKTQTTALNKLSAFAAVLNGFELALAPFFNSTASAMNSWQQVSPFVDRQEMEQVAKTYGYTLSEAQAFGL